MPGLAGGRHGPAALRPLVETVLTALEEGAAARGGPLPAGGPKETARRVAGAVGRPLPDHGTGPQEALHTLVRELARGAADPADPYCAAHLHCPPLALSAAAELAAASLNPSLDSWDQAPAATEIEMRACTALAAVVYPDLPAPDALMTTGGTESNQLALLLARERAAGGPRVQVVCGANAHHSVQRAAWLLGLPRPVVVDTPAGVLDPADADRAWMNCRAAPCSWRPRAPRTPVRSTRCRNWRRWPQGTARNCTWTRPTAARCCSAGTRPASSTGCSRPSPSPSTCTSSAGSRWRPACSRCPTVPRCAAGASGGLSQRHRRHRGGHARPAEPFAAYHPPPRRAEDRRHPAGAGPRGPGRPGGHRVRARAPTRRGCRPAPGSRPARRAGDQHRPVPPAGADDEQVAALRRELMYQGRAVLGRATAGGRLWLKATLLNPHIRPQDLDALLRLVTDAQARQTRSAP